MAMTESRSAAIVWEHGDSSGQAAVSLDEEGQLSKATLLRALARAFAFPNYFGDNWDAAYDLLLDQVDQLAEPALWRFSIEEHTAVDEDDLAEWVQLMTDVCCYAESRACPVRVVVIGRASADGAASIS